MRLVYRKKGFSLVEVLSVIAVMAVLLSLVLGVGKHVKEKGNIRLTESTIDILVTAVELYYQDNNDKMPFETLAGVDFSLSDFGSATASTMAVFSGTHSEPDWSGEALYYFLDKSLNSRRIINAINSSLVTSFDSAGQPLIVTVDGIINVDMPRFVDAWGNTLRYRYTAGATFCVITSAGPDKNFGTADDITNSN